MNGLELSQMELRHFTALQQNAMRDRFKLSVPNVWLSSSRLLSQITAKLENASLWQEFHAETNEMIITKTGRRMFPSIQLTVSGLDKHQSYYILLEIQPACTRRYKYCGNGAGQSERSNIGGWSFAGPAEPQPSFDRRIYLHPDGLATGDQWMQNTINFSKLKITNNAIDRDHLLLTSMHKYIPIIRIIQCNKVNAVTDLFAHPAISFTFDETAFIAVTAYQNGNITKLKINNNPFAKGFRETGQSQCKRKSQVDGDRETDDSSPSVESNRVCSLQKKRRKSTSSISGDDSCDTAKQSTSITAVQEPLREENNNNETSTRFHRPWLDTPSSNRPVTTVATAIPPLSQTVSPYHCWFPSCLFPNIPQMFTQQPNWRLSPYSLFHTS